MSDNNRSNKVLVVILTILLIGIIAFAVMIFLNVSKQDTPSTGILRKSSNGTLLTNYTGYDAAEIANTLGKENIKTELSENISEKPHGTILEQDPPAGTIVPSGATVYLLASSGPASAVLPDVLGSNMTDAFRILRETGFVNVQWRKEYAQGMDIGTVMEIHPEAGQIPLTQEITVTVCAGIKMEETSPRDYTGMNSKKAITAARKDKLIPIISYMDSERKAGTVLKQTVEKGAPVLAGTTIEFYVASGEQETREDRIMHTSIDMPETATGTKYRITAEGETFHTSYERLLDEGTTAPEFPYEIDVPVPARTRSLTLCYYEKSNGRYVQRASWPVVTPLPKEPTEVLDLDLVNNSEEPDA